MSFTGAQCHPPVIAQKPTVSKQYTYVESISETMSATEDNIKVSKLQKYVDSNLLFQTPSSKPSSMREDPQLKEGNNLKGVWFADASSYRQKNK